MASLFIVHSDMEGVRIKNAHCCSMGSVREDILAFVQDVDFV